ncbi:MAG: DEAD/DEAH box helicase family protein [Lachnospiraceae bacterium]|nr:DEAD/DEAH box helicase family protein [Lachnospiraceae bacterium]
MGNKSFFDRLFEGEINWAFHTTMTCDLLYSMQLAYKLAGKNVYKDILKSEEMNKTAVFYNKDAHKGRCLSFKGAGKKKKVKDYLCINHPVGSKDQTFHAKISLVSYNKKNNNKNQEHFRLAVYSKNCEFNDKCAETAIILNLEIADNETKSGKNLVDYITYLKKNTAPKSAGEKWIEEHIEIVYDQLSKCKFYTEFVGKEADKKEAELFFGGIEYEQPGDAGDPNAKIQYTILNDDLQLDLATANSVVLTPPEFIKGTAAQDYFEKTKQILYDLKEMGNDSKEKGNDSFSASHIKLYLLEKKNSSTQDGIHTDDKNDAYELWTGSANATVHGIGWSFSPNSFSGKPSVECLVKIPIAKDEFEKLKKQIANGYEQFKDFKKEGSLKKLPQDDFGPWICENMEVEKIEYKDSYGKIIGQNGNNNVSSYRGKANKICVTLKFKTNVKSTIPRFHSPIMCWRPAEYANLKGCVISSSSFDIEYDINGFRPSQGVLCFGTSQSIMMISNDVMKSIPQVEETKERDIRVSELLLFKDRILETDDLDDTPNEGIDWFYDVVRSYKGEKEKKLPCTQCSERELETKPMDFQVKAAKRLKQILETYDRAFLADEPGLGKTYSATKLICDMADERKEDKPFYVIYVAPNQSLLKKNGDDIISKAREGLLKNGWSIYSLNEYAGKKHRLIDAYIKAAEEAKNHKFVKGKDRITNCLEECLNVSISLLQEKEEKDFYKFRHKKIVNEIYKKIENKLVYGIKGTFQWNNSNDNNISKHFIDKTDTEKKQEIAVDRLAYAHKTIQDRKKYIIGKQIILITVSQGCLLGDDAGTDLEKQIIEEEVPNDTSKLDGKRNGFTKWFLDTYQPSLIIWDEYHRYLRKMNNEIPFLQPEIKNLFVSATPYKTNISGKNNKDLIENLYNKAYSVDRDDEEADAFSNLPSFEEFAELFCEGKKCLINGKSPCKSTQLQRGCLQTAYHEFCNASSKNKKIFENMMKEKMVRHERSRLQGEHEKHIRKYPAIENVGEEFRMPFLNTLRQSRCLENAGYQEGARKWSLSLPWILDFSTRDQNNGGNNYFKNLEPTNRNPGDELFVYEIDGRVKNSIQSLPEQNLAFYQICKENAYDKMRQLLWIPPSVPLYQAGNKSIFSVYSSYSKLLVFAEYRYLQRGGSRLLSDFIKYENIMKDKSVPKDFPIKLEWSAEIDKISKFDLLAEDYRGKDLDELIQLIKELIKEKFCEDWSTTQILAAIASPAICAQRLGLDPVEVENAFNEYLDGEGKKEALWNWICENGYENKWEEGILRYCAEGNLYAMLEEWLFVLKKDEEKTPTDQICDILRYKGSKVYVQTKETTENKEEGKVGHCSFAEQLTGDVGDNGSGQKAELTLNTANAFSSPLWPMVMFAGRGAQEGIDFHEYCLRIMHLTLPRGAVSYEQRNGRIDRFRSLLIRRRVAEFYMGYGIEAGQNYAGLMKKMFAKAFLMKEDLKQDKNEIFPNWHFHIGKSRWNFEELIPMWNYTDESSLMIAYDEMLKSYRGSLGMNATMSGDEGVDLSAKRWLT